MYVTSFVNAIKTAIALLEKKEPNIELALYNLKTIPENKIRNKTMKKDGSPRKPRKRTAYNMFLKKAMEEIKDEVSKSENKKNYKEFLGIAAQKWKNLSENDKQPFVNAANEQNISLA